jgi:hypothetical protein
VTATSILVTGLAVPANGNTFFFRITGIPARYQPNSSVVAGNGISTGTPAGTDFLTSVNVFGSQMTVFAVPVVGPFGGIEYAGQGFFPGSTAGKTTYVLGPFTVTYPVDITP